MNSVQLVTRYYTFRGTFWDDDYINIIAYKADAADNMGRSFTFKKKCIIFMCKKGGRYA